MNEHSTTSRATDAYTFEGASPQPLDDHPGRIVVAPWSGVPLLRALPDGLHPDDTHRLPDPVSIRPMQVLELVGYGHDGMEYRRAYRTMYAKSNLADGREIYRVHWQRVRA